MPKRTESRGTSAFLTAAPAPRNIRVPRRGGAATRPRHIEPPQAPFPVMLVYDTKVPHHVEVQTYDMPDTFHGRPTGAVGLLTSGLYCVADGLGNDLVQKGAGSEWLRIVWPSHAAGGGGGHKALATCDCMRWRGGVVKNPSAPGPARVQT